jgi:hypothetical protein
MLDLEISKPEHWGSFQKESNAILGPMIFRTGDVFLRGRSKVPAEQQEFRWNAISQNIDSLFAFFDALILNDRLPLIDFGYTFDRHLGFGTSATDDLPIIQMCNQDRKILHNVHVHGDAYLKVKKAATQTLKGHPPVQKTLVSEIGDELSAFDYEWRPILPRDAPMTDEDQLVHGCDNIIQPKRSRLLLSLSLEPGKPKPATARLGTVLFHRLRSAQALQRRKGPDYERCSRPISSR